MTWTFGPGGKYTAAWAAGVVTVTVTSGGAAVGTFSGIGLATVAGAQALIPGLVAQAVGSGAVTSVFGRTGAVAAQSGDYTYTQVGADVSGAAAGVQALLPTTGSPLPLAKGGTGLSEASDAALLAALGGLVLQAATAAAGFALQNATPSILTWTAPADGNNHRVVIVCSEHVTSAITGGVVQASITTPDGGAGVIANSLLGGGVAAGFRAPAFSGIVVESGSTVTIEQTTAMTAGAATVWAEIWGL